MKMMGNEKQEGPEMGGERPTAVIYRVSAVMLNVMQRKLPRQSDGGIHVRLGIAAIAGAMARWLAVGTNPSLDVDRVVNMAQEEIRPLITVMLRAERERLAVEAAEKATEVGN